MLKMHKVKSIEFRHEKLEVWHLAMDFTDKVYQLTKSFPKEEQFGLTTQVRRASVSVALNIAEGASRQSNKDFAHFVRNAIGSLMEAVTGLEIGLRQRYLNESDFESVREIIQELYFKLLGLDKALRSKFSN